MSKGFMVSEVILNQNKTHSLTKSKVKDEKEIILMSLCEDSKII
jgi:hypothetical protein